ncbi:HAD family hydrolase [Histidinibacterium aquaticum]|uniref:HAD family hydrolase n=1 Tax=Histidinibacterium aquaticum TaxID=2613962 RepID=A0A5J5GP72_9RHOB|nr:hypothetical protein [Histidinibacterium aquaticum]KAA9010129.1 hypothetical protein F3S47_02420 [Histidinibacterium aquaticum]
MVTMHVPFSAILWVADGVFGPDHAVLAPSDRLLEISDKASRRGLRQAVVSNGEASALEPQLAALPEAETVIGTDDLTRAAEEMGLEPPEILLVSTSSATIHEAARAGFRTFKFSTLALDALDARLPSPRR